MSNLIPEVRTDKNGNAVTRWIRSLGKKSTSATIPAPVITREPASADPSNEQAIMELCGLLQPVLHYNPTLRLPMSVAAIAENDMELLRGITRAVRESAAEGAYWEERLERANNLNHENPDAREQELNECRVALSINPLLLRLIEHDPISYMHKIEPTLYVESIAEIMEDSGIKNPPEDLTRAITMIAYIKQFHRDDWTETGGVTYDSIATDAAYIAEHIDRVEDLLPELRARETHDRAVIDLLINSNAKSLREGEL